jgi:nitrogen fixation/metabolism regulation signal transduction histidine kinase
MRNQLLVQERGRANISLSRNLGHDLTNIIATSKLDLLALDRLLHDGRPPQDDARRAMLAEALDSLMRSVRFMQETVNLYRSYAFLQRPVLETQDANRLVGDTLDLFMMSISSKIRIVRELAEDAPRCMVDPRLVKLALFNLFVNAMEAIRKHDADQTVSGWIKVATRRAESGGLTIAIEDSGPGIRNPQGVRAAPHEIEKIFELGYTSQRVGPNHKEGLGLAWVRTIVHDLHGGTIRAENVEGGGARFVLTFPPLAEATTPAK